MAVADTAYDAEDTVAPVTGNVLTNDTDVDGDALTVTQFEVGGATFVAGQTAAITGVGSLTIYPDGSYTFIPAPNYDGPVPVATYTVSDGAGGTDTGTLTLTVTPVDDFVPTPEYDEPNLPSGPDYEFQAIEASGAVVDAVNEIQSLSTPIRFELRTFLGGSSTIVIDHPGSSGQEKVRIETVKKDGIIYMQVIEETGDGEKASILSYRITAPDGSPAPAWLSQVGPYSFIGNPDAGTGPVDLILTITGRDGQVSNHVLQLDSFSGHLSQPPKSEIRGFEGSVPMFTEQLHERSRNQQIGLLEKALGFV